MKPADTIVSTAPVIEPEHGWVELEGLCVVSFRGGAARGFLGRQLTCDVDKLTPQSPAFGAWLTPKGRVLALLRLIERAPDRFDAVVSAPLADGVIRRMRLFVMRDDVSIDVDPGQAVVGLWGRCAQSPVTADPGVVTISLRTHPDLAMAVGDRAALRATLDACADRPGQASHWRRLCIEAGLPQLEPATQESFIPQMINLDRLAAVSFSKGCYPGQEIVARTQHLGRIKRRMFIARAPSTEIHDLVRPGDVIVGDGGEDIGGRVLAIERGPLDTVLLAVLPLDSATLQGTVRLHDASGPRLRIEPPPYSLVDPPQ